MTTLYMSTHSLSELQWRADGAPKELCWPGIEDYIVANTRLTA